MGCRLLAVLTGVAMLLTGCGPAASSSSVGPALSYHNPVFPRPFPDPMALQVNRHDFWAYGTSLEWEGGYFPILHSTDLVHWRYAGHLFGRMPSWMDGDPWGPDVVHRGSTYYAYFTGLNWSSEHCIGVATASNPAGPFRSRGEVACQGISGSGYIDPDLFLDGDGRAYLYVAVDGPPHSIGVLPMRADLLRPAGAIVTCFGVTQNWESAPHFSTVEGPFTIRRGRTYYLFYSGGDTGSAQYAVGYATAASPTGPFHKYRYNPILRPTRQVPGPGGESVVTGPDNRLWMVYHAWSHHIGFQQGDTRTLRIDPIVWHGTVPSVAPTP